MHLLLRSRCSSVAAAIWHQQQFTAAFSRFSRLTPKFINSRCATKTESIQQQFQISSRTNRTLHNSPSHQKHSKSFDTHRNMTTTSNSSDASKSNSTTIAHSIDRYNGIIVSPQQILQTYNDHSSMKGNLDFASYFKQLLQSSLKEWSSAGRTGCLIDLPLSNSAACIDSLYKEGFICHHAEGEIICLTIWLPNWAHKYAQAADSSIPARPPSPNMIPSYPFTSLGCGSFVIRSNGDVLVITELRSHVKDFWKLAGGAVDRNEDLSVCAVREVKEETGIDCQFRSIIGFRHILQYNTRQNTGDSQSIVQCLCCFCRSKISKIMLFN
jgi:hypothetical protein